MENQKLPRLTVKEIRNETLSYFNLEKGLLFTFVQMFKDPFKAVQGYLYENRKKYFNPFRYILFGTGMYTLLIKLNKGFQSALDISTEMNKGNLSNVTEKVKIPLAEIIAFSQNKVADYQNLIYLMLVPLVSFVTYKLLKEKKYNYAENLAIHSFIFGTTLWTGCIILGLTSWFNFKFIMILMSLLTYTLIVYFYKRIFDTTWIMSLATMLIVIISTSIVTSIFMIPIIVYKVFDYI